MPISASAVPVESLNAVGTFALPILAIIFGYALVMGILGQRAKARQERVRLLEEALKNPQIDRGTLEVLSQQLTGGRAQRPGASRTMAMILGLGWLLLFLGVGLYVGGEMVHEGDLRISGIICGIMGFGLVTYPFALRELESRRAQQ